MKTIQFKKENGGGWITLDRDDKLNAFNQSMISDINDALDQCQHDDTIFAIVITGNGRAFCAGGDLEMVNQSMGQGPDDDRTVTLLQLCDLLCRFEHYPKPIIAAVNGFCLAGGLEIAAACDMVFASDQAKIGDVHAKSALLPGGGASQRLPRKLGPNFANYLLFTGEILPPERFVASGFIQEVLAHEQLLPRVAAVVANLTETSLLTTRRLKTIIRDGAEQPLASGLRLELIASEAHANSEDMREGVSAFVEKRKPVYKHR